MARSTYDDFLIKEKIGSGSYGVVFKVIRKLDRMPYAMKEIDLQGMSRKEQEECIRETRVLSSLDSDYIIKYYDSFLERGKLYIITEYASNGNLHDYIKRQKQKLPEELIWRLFLQILLGLNHMHAKKILHRDIKSLNVFLDEQLNVKLGDMGVAKILSTHTSFAKTIVGTPYYLSPELCEDKPYNEKSDVWALGVVLYECCVQRHPFDADNQGALILKILRGKYPPVAGYSQEVSEVIKLCLTQNANRRPNTFKLLLHPVVRQHGHDMGIVMPDQHSLLPLAERSSKGRPPLPVHEPMVQQQQQQQAAQAQQPTPAGELAIKPAATANQAQAGNSTIRRQVSRRASDTGSQHSSGTPAQSKLNGTIRRASDTGNATHSNGTQQFMRTQLAAPKAPTADLTRLSLDSQIPSTPDLSKTQQRAPAQQFLQTQVQADPRPVPQPAPQQQPQQPPVHGNVHSPASVEEDEEDNPYANPISLQDPADFDDQEGEGETADEDDDVIDEEEDEGFEEDEEEALDEEDDGLEEEEGYEEDVDAEVDQQQQQQPPAPVRNYSSNGGWQPDVLRLQHMKSAMMLQRAACLDLIGEKAFNELYALLRSSQVDETSMTDLSRLVFKIIPYDKSEVIQMMYKLLYLESQLESGGQ